MYCFNVAGNTEAVFLVPSSLAVTLCSTLGNLGDAFYGTTMCLSYSSQTPNREEEWMGMMLGLWVSLI
jgi:hypothetical protein